MERVTLRWPVNLDRGDFLGDAWERGYGDLSWQKLCPERIFPWYLLVREDGRTDGYGVETGCAAMCSWRTDGTVLELSLDVRNGGSGVILQGRILTAAVLVSREGKPDETPFTAAQAFCRQMCTAPRYPREPIY